MQRKSPGFQALCKLCLGSLLILELGCTRPAPPSGSSPFKDHVRELQSLEAHYGAWNVTSHERAPLLEILTHLAKTANLPVPPLSFLATREPLAFLTSAGQVVLSRGLLERLPSESQIAFVVAHELGHRALRHPRSGHEDPATEAAADTWAWHLLHKSGYDPYEGCFALAELSVDVARLRGLGCLPSRNL